MTPRILALCGGVGGAKLALGLDSILPAGDLTVVVNTGDDFDHYGLRICPDIDTVIYTLSGRASKTQGWGRENESWNFMSALAEMGGDTWFSLGDQDLAVHILRTHRLNQGERLTSITLNTARRLGIKATVLPMTDSPVATYLDTDEGLLPFQTYFVKERCRPVVKRIEIQGASSATVSPELAAAFDSPRLEAILICPSNPFLSIDPILAIPSIGSRLAARSVPTIAVTPIIGDAAIKGPTTKIMRELGIEATVHSVARHYGRLLDGFVVDSRDRHLADRIDVRTRVSDTMQTLDDRRRLADEVLDFARSLRAD